MKKLVDAGTLLSAIRTRDPQHWQCSSYFRNHPRDTWVIPANSYFEYQTAQARLKKQTAEPYRELFLANWEVYDVSFDLIRKAAEHDLVNRFAALSGADLVCACIAKIEQIPLVTTGSRFSDYAAEIDIINP